MSVARPNCEPLEESMPKKDIAITISAADHLLETTEHPLHRRILENYRRHAILEICGEWEGIFDPEMCAEHPVYYFNITGMDGLVADGADAVKQIYRTLAETQTCVMLVEDEQLWVNDWDSPPTRRSSPTSAGTT
jgi:hypothetical protein